MNKIKNSVIALMLLSIFACSQKPKESEFNEYIEAFTYGTISVESTITVQLSQPVDDFSFDDNNAIKDLFKIKPQIKGNVHLHDDNSTIEFVPDEDLKPDTEYQVVFQISKVIKAAKGKKATFEFSFATRKPSFTYKSSIDMSTPNDYNLYTITGNIYTNDKVNNNDLEKTLSIKTKEKYNTKWTHEGNTHVFRIDSIDAKDKDFFVYIEINGKGIGSDQKVEDTIKIPNTTDFVLLGIDVNNNSEMPELVCTFSHPIDTKQALKGLVTIDGCTDDDGITYMVRLNKIYVYPKCDIIGSRNVTIHKGIRNIKGLKLEEDYTEEIEFRNLKPDIELLCKGGILPNSNGLIVPFQTVMVKAVNVKIIKVYENNIMQFLQVNNITGSREMKRAGRLIAMKTIKLDDENSKKLRKWNTYSLDLANIIKPEPGAIYRIEMNFTRSQSLYECNDNYTGKGDDYFESQFENEQNAYDRTSNYYYDDYYYYDYDYDDYDSYGNKEGDPCSDYYYNRTNVACNVLASDIGVIAKIDNMKTVKAAISNLVTAKPMNDVTVEIYNYQQQLIGNAKTSSDGLAEITYSNSKPYLLIAKYKDQRSYLRLDDASSLNMSSFDVSGAVVEKGLKGYIYGERGIWRPGDTLFLNFILNDPNNIIPKNHPVEFELVNPLGQTIIKKKAVGNQYNFFPFTVQTESDAPTGNWMVYAKIGGTTFSKRVKIETIKPNRLKIELKIDPLSLSTGTIEGSIESRWLHGAVAKNLQTDVNAMLIYTGTYFKGYESYYFDDRSKYYTTDEINVFEGKLDENGTVQFKKKISCNAPGMVTATFLTRVIEDGGEFSINSIKEKIIPYKSFVGIRPPKGTGHYGMLETDKEQIYDVICLDADGKPVTRDNIEVSIYKADWNWWWTSFNGRWASYSHQAYKNQVANFKIDVKNGKGTFTHKAEHNDWGYYYIAVTDKESNHRTSIASYYDWPGWAGAPRQEGGGEGATMLTIAADKQKYNVGEKAIISFPSTEGSRALISIESGSKVQQMFWVDGKSNETKVNIDITEEMVPNIYVNISLIQPHAQTANDLPIRLYGIIPVNVENEKTILKPKISMPEVLRPEETFKIKVSEENNQPMTYTIAIVDDGLLDITNFKTPNAWTTFFAREALGIRSFDIYNFVIGAYGGKIEQLFAIGGGDEGNGDDSKSDVNRFKPVVKVLGPFTLKSGSNEHSVNLPNYVGSVRAMIVAGNDKAYGSAEKTVPVRKPLMILATLPRVLGPGEDISLTANVFAMEDNIKNVKVEVKANDIFEYTDEKTKSISFKTTGDEFISFKLKTKEKLGAGKIKLIATSGSEKAEYDIDILVRNANPKIYSTEGKILSAGQTWDGKYHLQGIEGTNAVSVEISTFPPINLKNRLDYLIQYPHGCIEQTTSAAFPQIYLNSITELSLFQKNKTEENVKAALYRLRSFITTEGGFAYWSGDRYANLWGTSYAGHFMIEAEAQGYAVPQAMKSNWVKFQKREANEWTKSKQKGNYYSYSQNDFDQAYRLYTLALAKEPEMGAMNRLKEYKDLSLQSKWMLAAAYAVAGQTQTAKNIINNLATEVEPYSGFSQSFGSSERDMAMIVETLMLLSEKELAFTVAKRISEKLNSNQWMSTQTTAYCLRTLSRFAAQYANKQINFSYNDGGIQNVKTEKTIWKTDIKHIGNNNNLDITNKTDAPMFVTVQTEGIPLAGDEIAQANGLKISVQYVDDEQSIIDVSNLPQGKIFMARVYVTNNGTGGNYNNLVLSQVFPSGWEIINSRITDDNEENGSYQTFTYRDIRDDRVYTHFDLNAGNSKTFYVKLTAAYKGKFYLPAQSCEAMYDAKISANNTGKWVTVY
ncbi:MAG: Ig-like domain-containing protein [Prevotellaceae bacterium]|jgi:uncharacterized protein YfaS (alpha-2-macroglobulin family)|nr:Ig-like domain-containing protein [Prevotellaceae bacterium]